MQLFQMAPLSCPGLFREQLPSGIRGGYTTRCGNTALFYTPASAETPKDVGIALALLPLAKGQGFGMTQTPMWLVLPFIRIRS